MTPVVLLLVGAVLLWIASRVVWLDVTAFNDQSGEALRALVGTEWQPALVPLALGALAAIAAVGLVRGAGARVVGGIIALLGVAAGGLMFSALGEPDKSHAHSVVTSEENLGRTNSGPGTTGSQSVPEWSEITEITVHPVGAGLTGAAALALLAAGAFIMVRPTRKVGGDDRYVTPAARRENARTDATSGTGTGVAAKAGAESVSASGATRAAQGDVAPGESTADTGRDLWLELDEGRDPTS